MQYIVGDKEVTINGIASPAGAILELSEAEAAPFVQEGLIAAVASEGSEPQEVTVQEGLNQSEPVNTTSASDATVPLEKLDGESDEDFAKRKAELGQA